MGYTEVYRDAREEQILQKLTVACADAARTIYTEATNTANYANRRALVAYAGPGTADFRRFAQEIALVVLVLNPTLTAASADSAFLAAVNAIWSPYANLLVLKGAIQPAPVAAPQMDGPALSDEEGDEDEEEEAPAAEPSRPWWVKMWE